MHMKLLKGYNSEEGYLKIGSQEDTKNIFLLKSKLIH